MVVCKNCHKEIKFDNKIVSVNGKLIPLNSDGSKHSCRIFESGTEVNNGNFVTADKLLEERTIDNVVWFIDEIIKNRLHHHRIKLFVEKIDS